MPRWNARLLVGALLVLVADAIGTVIVVRAGEAFNAVRALHFFRLTYE